MLIRTMRRLTAAVCVAMLPAVAALAQVVTFDTAATAAYVYDQSTGTVLLEKNADIPLPPASMSKLMTIYMAFDAIATGRLGIDEELTVSQHAMDYTGSSMFLRAGERVRVEDLLRGIIVLSGNDASAVIAEALSPDGTEAGFARLSTQRAQQMGMANSTFANSNGWPDPNHRMSMRDLGILADHLIRDFPTFYPIFGEQEYLFDGRVPSNSQNRNPILGLGIGADGLKTGHTAEAGYSLVGSAKQGDRRIIFVFTGLDSAASRAQEAEKIVNWAFRQFALKEVVGQGTELARADVWNGAATSVGMTVAEPVSLLLPAFGTAGVSAQVIYDSPVAAPVTAGQQLGELVITPDGLPETRVPLVAQNGVEAGGFMVRLKTAATVLMAKFAPAPAAAPAEGS